MGGAPYLGLLSPFVQRMANTAPPPLPQPSGIAMPQSPQTPMPQSQPAQAAAPAGQGLLSGYSLAGGPYPALDPSLVPASAGMMSGPYPSLDPSLDPGSAGMMSGPYPNLDPSQDPSSGASSGGLGSMIRSGLSRLFG